VVSVRSVEQLVQGEYTSEALQGRLAAAMLSAHSSHGITKVPARQRRLAPGSRHPPPPPATVRPALCQPHALQHTKCGCEAAARTSRHVRHKLGGDSSGAAQQRQRGNEVRTGRSWPAGGGSHHASNVSRRHIETVKRVPRVDSHSQAVAHASHTAANHQHGGHVDILCQGGGTRSRRSSKSE
jgi:hypothetical protein